MRKTAGTGISLVGVLLLAGCAASAPPLPPVPTSVPEVTIVEPSTTLISPDTVDSRGFERNADSEAQILFSASLGDEPGAVPDPGAQTFPSYAEESGAAVPTAEYALNLMYWGCEQARDNPTGATDIGEFAQATAQAAATVTGFGEDTPQLAVYAELMFRGMEQLCQGELLKFEGYTPVETAG